MKLHPVEGGYVHDCPGCLQRHFLPLDRGWTFDGNLDAPTFTPSFKHIGREWDWYMDTWKLSDPLPPAYICHYVLTAGLLNFQPDCTHSLAGVTVPLVDSDWSLS